MPELTTKIGAYNPESRTVPVKFTSGDIVHERRVNAVLTVEGKYDAKATKARVAEVARGVAAKIDLGVIVAPIEDAAPAEGE